jgi:hypothetical protein
MWIDTTGDDEMGSAQAMEVRVEDLYVSVTEACLTAGGVVGMSVGLTTGVGGAEGLHQVHDESFS